jgi:hypothetical protein
MDKLKYSMEFEKEKIQKEENVAKKEKNTYTPSVIELLMGFSLFFGLLGGIGQYLFKAEAEEKEKKIIIEKINKINVFENFEDIS